MSRGRQQATRRQIVHDVSPSHGSDTSMCLQDSELPIHARSFEQHILTTRAGHACALSRAFPLLLAPRIEIGLLSSGWLTAQANSRASCTEICYSTLAASAFALLFVVPAASTLTTILAAACKGSQRFGSIYSTLGLLQSTAACTRCCSRLRVLMAFLNAGSMSVAPAILGSDGCGLSACSLAVVF